MGGAVAQRPGSLPLLARCRMVSICSPDSFAFFMADVARGQPDKLGTTRQEMALVMGLKAHRETGCEPGHHRVTS